MKLAVYVKQLFKEIGFELALGDVELTQQDVRGISECNLRVQFTSTSYTLLLPATFILLSHSTESYFRLDGKITHYEHECNFRVGKEFLKGYYETICGTN